MRRGYVDLPEGQIHFRASGSGEPILLLHQTSFFSDEYSDVIPILAKHYWAIALDTLGYGFSDKLSSQYTIEDYALSVVRFLDVLGIERTNVVGNHTGATIAVEMAVSWPNRVNKLILSGCSLYSAEERESLLNSPKYSPLQLTRDGSFLLREWEHCLNASSYASLEIVFRRFIGNLLASPRLHDGHLASYRYDKRPKLPLIKSPTLLITATGEKSYSKLEEIRSLLPGCTTKVIKEAGGFIAGV